MTITTIILIALVIIVSLLLVIVLRASFFKLENGTQDSDMLNQNIQAMHQRLDEATKILGDRLDRSHSHMLTTFTNLSQLMGSVGKELGGVREIGSQLSRLQTFINSPKIKGNIGEHVLYDSLAKVLPRDSFRTQHKFKEGSVVDALIITEHGHISVDAKHTTEDALRIAEAESEEDLERARHDFQRATKKHIDSIAKKYILPDEGTVDFAIMYVPAETVYYEMVSEHHDLSRYAHDRRVLLVSPNSFFHFLRVILVGLERSKIEGQTEELWRLMKSLSVDFKKFGKQIDVLSRHVTNAKSSIDGVTSEYQRIGTRLDNIKVLK